MWSRPDDLSPFAWRSRACDFARDPRFCNRRDLTRGSQHQSSAKYWKRGQAVPGCGSLLPLRAELISVGKAVFPLRRLRQRDAVEHRGALIAQDRESAADSARRFIVTVTARRVEVDAGAGH